MPDELTTSEVQNEQAPAAAVTTPATPEAAQTTTEPAQQLAAAQPLTEERIKQLIEEKAAAIAAQAVEKGKREMQSVKDAEIRRMQRDYERKLRLAESTAASIESTVRTYDPETGGDIRTQAELAKLRAESQFHQSAEQEEQQRQAQEQYTQQLVTSLHATLDKFSIARDDKRIDWGEGARDYLEGRSRFDASVAAILAEKQKTEASNLEQSFKATLQAEILKMRKEAGLETVDIGQPAGTSTSGIPTNMAAFRAWVSDLPLAEYEKRKPAIDKMMAEGKIK